VLFSWYFQVLSIRNPAVVYAKKLQNYNGLGMDDSNSNINNNNGNDTLLQLSEALICIIIQSSKACPEQKQ